MCLFVEHIDGKVISPISASVAPIVLRNDMTHHSSPVSLIGSMPPVSSAAAAAAAAAQQPMHALSFSLSMAPWYQWNLMNYNQSCARRYGLSALSDHHHRSALDALDKANNPLTSDVEEISVGEASPALRHHGGSSSPPSNSHHHHHHSSEWEHLKRRHSDHDDLDRPSSRKLLPLKLVYERS